MNNKRNILPAHPAVTGWRRLGRWLMAPALLVMSLFAVAGTSSASPHATGFGPSITVGIIGDYDNLNPDQVAVFQDVELDAFFYDTLVFMDNQGHLHPYLASSWTTTPTSVTFTIRNGATCSDGTPVTPAVVAASLQYYTAPATAGTEKSQIFGPGPVTVTSSQANDTVTVSLTKPWNGFIDGFAQPNLGIICPSGLKDPTSLKNQPAGSGPFVLTSAVRGDQYVLTARKGYDWGPDGASTSANGFPSSIVIKVINDTTTAANQLTTGGLSLVNIVGPGTPTVQRLTSDTSIQHILNTVPSADGLLFNEEAGHPGADPAVRHALELAVSASQYNTAESYGASKVMKTLYTPGMLCYNPADGSLTPGYNPAEAKRILEADGWKPNSSGKLEKNGKVLTVHIVGFPAQNNGPAYIQSALDAIGVNAVLSVTNLNAYYNVTYSTGNWDVQDFPYAAPFPTPENIAVQSSGVVPPHGFNVAFVKNAAYDREVAAAQVQSSTAKGCKIWDQAEKTLLANYVVKPLVTFPSDFFGQKSVTFTSELGILINPFTLRS